MTTPNELRKQFNALGYTLSIKSNPLNPSIANLVVTGKGLRKLMISSADVFSVETYKEHETLFNLANSVRQTIVGAHKIS